MDYNITCNNIRIPQLGFGTAIYSSMNEEELEENIVFAVKNGYRLIDTAWIYKTEKIVGRAIGTLVRGGVKREELFVQTKFYPQMPYGYKEVISQFEESMTNLGLDYVDAYLLHQPIPRYAELEYKKRNKEAWRAVEYLYKIGRIKTIGVSNFLERHIEYLAEDAEIFPMINQLEINPYFQQIGLSEWCHKHNIIVQSWGPLSKGNVESSEIITNIANEYNVKVAQLCLKWNIQMGNIPIVSSSKKQNILSDLNLNFSISEIHMNMIRELNTSTGHRETWWYPRQQMY